jgi:hypothetical protein
MRREMNGVGMDTPAINIGRDRAAVSRRVMRDL